MSSGINMNLFPLNSKGYYTDDVIHLVKLNDSYSAVNELICNGGDLGSKSPEDRAKCIRDKNPPYILFDPTQSIDKILQIKTPWNVSGDGHSLENGIFNKITSNGKDYLVNQGVFRDDYRFNSDDCVKNNKTNRCSTLLSSYNNIIHVNPDASNVPFKGKNYQDSPPGGVYVNQTFYNISGQDPACYWDWHVRNSNYTSTGINIADGDEMSISWGGDTFVGNGNTANYVDYKLAKYALVNGGYLSVKNIDKSIVPKLASPEVLLKEMSGLDILWTNGTSSPSKDAIFGEDGRPQDHAKGGGTVVGCGNPAKDLPAPSLKWYGLTGSVVDVPMLFNDATDPNDKGQHVDCSDILDPGLARYSYSGVLSGLTSGRYGLSLRHRVPKTGHINTDSINNDPASSDGTAYYRNVLGGQQVSVDWGGCPMKTGDGIKCGFVAIDDSSSGNSSMTKPVPGSIDTSKIVWQDVSQQFIDQGRASITAPDDGSSNAEAKTKYRLYCRLDASKAVASIKGDVRPDVAAMAKPSSAVGGYHMVIESSMAPDWKQSNSLMRQIIDTVMQTLLGTTCVQGQAPAGGVVKIVYEGVAKNIAPYITVLLTLSLCFTGIAYMIGLAKMNQQDMLNRVLKMALIIAVTSPTGWEFFGGKMVQAFSCGTLQIASQIVVNVNAKNADDPLYNTDIAAQPTAIYDEVLDGPRVMIFNDVVWKKMGALIITGLTGLILVIIIIISAILIWVATIRAGLIFIFSIIAQALLFVTAPLFFVFLLFSQTKSMFDEWCKNVIAYALVPIVLFGSMSLFAMIVIALIYSTMNFTICPTCLINIPILNICMLSGWQSIAASHYPPEPGILSFFSPFGAMVGGLCLIIASYGMLQFAKTSVDVVIRVVTFNASITRAGITDIPTKMAKEGVSVAKDLGKAAVSVARKMTTGV